MSGDNRNEVREFLTTRRARTVPEQVGLASSGHRRVTGLRRTEVALLAGVSVEYYAKIERGNLAGVSEGVLSAIARALQFDDAEWEYLVRLASAADGSMGTVRRRASREWTLRASLSQVLDAITLGPALIRNGRMDILSTNALGAAFYDHALDAPGRGNLARFQFLDNRSKDFTPDWDAAADIVVAILRSEVARDPHDRGLQDLIGELSTQSEEFRTRWGAHNVRRHGAGSKHFHHRIVGDLTLSYEDLELTAEPGIFLLIYTAELGSESQERLKLLASWAADSTGAETDADRAR